MLLAEPYNLIKFIGVVITSTVNSIIYPFVVLQHNNNESR